jgi:Cu-processing system permease protein
MPVPVRWRTGQIVVLALIAIAAFAYYKFVFSLPTTPDKSIADFLGFLVLAGLTWLTTPTAGTIATSTLQEALRRRWVIGFLAFSVIVILSSGSLTFVQLGEEQRFLQDFGTGFIIAMTILIAIFLGVTLVPPEIERRTIFTILSKPVNRAEFLVGKFLGLCLTLFFCLFVLSALFLLTFVIFNLRQSPNAWTTGTANNPDATLAFQTMNLAKALILHYGQLVVLASLSLMLSLIVTPITAITFCFLAYFGGQMSSYWGHLGGGDDHGHGDEDSAHGLSKPMQGIVKVVYYALPRMDRFDVRQQLVTDTPVATSTVWKAWSSGLVYVAVLLLIGYLVFSDREF